METMRHIFMDNYQLCNEISDRVVHHLVHSITTHGKHVQCLKFLLTIVKGDGKYVKKCQDKVMTEVRMLQLPHDGTNKTTARSIDDISARLFPIRLRVQLVNAGEEVLVFYNDRSSFAKLVEMMGSEEERANRDGALSYHNALVDLLAACTEGKNVYTELKCNSLLPLDDIVKVVTDLNCIPEVEAWYSTA